MASIIQRDLKDRVKNDTFKSVIFTIDDTGTPIDLTDVTIQIQFRYRCKTGTIVKDVSTAAGITLSDPTAGEFTLDAFTPVDWEVGTYYYDAQITFTDSTIRTYFWGNVKVLQDVTDS